MHGALQEYKLPLEENLKNVHYNGYEELQNKKMIIGGLGFIKKTMENPKTARDFANIALAYTSTFLFRYVTSTIRRDSPPGFSLLGRAMADILIGRVHAFKVERNVLREKSNDQNKEEDIINMMLKLIDTNFIDIEILEKAMLKK